jgi:hypothetical protein
MAGFGHAHHRGVTGACQPPVDYRRELYQALGHRKDSLFKLMEAALCASSPEPLVRLSLIPGYRRRWPSACDGLADGSLDAEHLRRHFVRALPPPAGTWELWGIDGTTWPRPSAATSPERTYVPAGKSLVDVPDWASAKDHIHSA